MSVNYRLIATKIIGQRKSFSKYVGMTKKHAVYQKNEHTSLDNKEVEPVKTVLNIYQSNTYKKDLLKLAILRQCAKDSRETASEGPTVLHIRFCSLSSSN